VHGIGGKAAAFTAFGAHACTGHGNRCAKSVNNLRKA
jgi:hypothetical protein